MTETKRPLDLVKLPTYHRNAIRRLEQLGAGLSILARYCRDAEPKYSEYLNGHARWIMLAAAMLDEQPLTASNLARALELVSGCRYELPKRFMLSVEARGFVDQSVDDFTEARKAIDELTDALLDARAMRRVEQDRLMTEGDAPIGYERAAIVVHVLDGVIEVVKDRTGSFPVRVTIPGLIERLERDSRIGAL